MDNEDEFIQVALLLMRRQVKQLDQLKAPLRVRTRMAVLRIAVDRLYADFFSAPSPVSRTDDRQGGEGRIE